MKKKILVVLCMLLCLFVTSVTASAAESGSFDEATLQEITQSVVSNWFNMNFRDLLEEYKDELEQDEYKDVKKEYEEFADLQEACGAYKEAKDFQFSYETEDGEEVAVVKVLVECEKDNLTATFYFDSTSNLLDYKFEKYKEEKVSVGKTMKTAGINTVMSMGIVFAVLILIAAIISCFILIGKIQDFVREDTPAVSAAKIPEPVAKEEAAEEDLTEDLELVAVITAAIVAASGAESADGLVVRSIVRR